MLLAFFPTAVFLSAVYAEALFLALAIGSMYFGRLGRWPVAALLAALAAATRSSGILLVAPLLVFYLYGPRGEGGGDAGPAHPWWRPRFRLRADVLWLAVVPLGLVAYLGFLELDTGHAFAPFHAEAAWKRHFAGPWGGIWEGTVGAADAIRALVTGHRTPSWLDVARNDIPIPRYNLLQFAALVFALVAAVGVVRRLPLAYGVYTIAFLALPLSYPSGSQPLISLSRFVLVIFPFFMWMSVWSAKGRRYPALLGTSAVLLAVFAAQFATWDWIG